MGNFRSKHQATWWPMPLGSSLALSGLVAIGVLGVTATQWFKASPPAPAPPTSETAQGIAAIGRLEPKGELITISAPAFQEGARVEKLFVALGDRVQAGQPIARLDSHEKSARAVDLAKQQLHVARMRLLQVEAGAKTGEIQAQSSRVTELRRELEGQVASQTLGIRRLGYELKNAHTECQRYTKLLAAGAISASQKDNICLIADTTRQQKLESEAHLQRTRHTLLQQINEASSSRAAVAEVRPIDVSVAKAEVEEAVARVKQAEADLNLSIVRSPRGGQVLRVITREGERIGNEGIVELGDTRQMTVVAEVYETDVIRVRKGQIATIKGQGLPKNLSGVVNEVGLTIDKKDLLGTDPAAASDARVLEVKIDLSPESSQLSKRLTNLQVDVVIYPSKHRL